MKNWKFIFSAMILLVFSVSIFANGEKDGELSNTWKDVGENVKGAAQSFGNAMSETGKQAGEKFSEAVNTNYYGTWVFKSGSTTTSITLKEDKTAEITQESSHMTETWRGTFSGAVAFLSFKITESERVISGKKTTVSDEKKWSLNYKISKDGNTMTVKCENIPTTEDGHNFSEDSIFILQ